MCDDINRRPHHLSAPLAACADLAWLAEHHGHEKYMCGLEDVRYVLRRCRLDYTDVRAIPACLEIVARIRQLEPVLKARGRPLDEDELAYLSRLERSIASCSTPVAMAHAA